MAKKKIYKIERERKTTIVHERSSIDIACIYWDPLCTCTVVFSPLHCFLFFRQNPQTHKCPSLLFSLVCDVSPMGKTKWNCAFTCAYVCARVYARWLINRSILRFSLFGSKRGRFFFYFLSLCCCFCFRLSWWCRCCCIYGVVCARVQVPHQFFIFFIHCHFGRTIHVISTNSFGCCYCCCCCLPAFSLNFLWATGAYLLPIFLLNPTWAETSILLIQFQHRTLC